MARTDNSLASLPKLTIAMANLVRDYRPAHAGIFLVQQSSRLSLLETLNVCVLELHDSVVQILKVCDIF